MGYTRKIAVVLAIAITAMFLLQITIPSASASLSNNLAGSSKATPWPNALPKSVEMPLLSSMPKEKIDPEIFKQIDNGATSIQAIIVVDWAHRYDLLQRLPPSSTLLSHASEIMKYLPFIGVNLPPDKNAIKAIADLPYVKMIVYNHKGNVRDVLQFIDPEKEIEFWKNGLYPSPDQVISQAYFETTSLVAQEVNATALWNMGITGKGVLIGIIDTAINPRHPDFFFANGTSKIVYTFSPFSGEDAYSNYVDMLYYAGHGTHVASIAAASGQGSGEGWYYNPAVGLYVRTSLSKGSEIGMAPDAKIAFFKIFPTYSPEWDLFDIVAAIVQAVKVGVDVINASWAFEVYDVYEQSIIYSVVAWVIQNGIVWVNAAGNYGPGYVTLGFPGAQESVITVGATYPINWATAGFGEKVIWWSSRGPTYPANSYFQNGADILPTAGPLSAGRTKPDVVAPGVAIMAANAGFEYPVPRRTSPSSVDAMFGTKYKALSGTSMAAPVVTGIVALLIQAFPGATPAAIKAALVKGATPVSTVLGVSDPNIGGAGKVNAYNAWKILNAAPKNHGSSIPPPYWTETDKLSPDGYKKIFQGVKILVDDITAVANRLNPLNSPVYPLYGYDRFLRDLRNRGADIHYLSQDFNYAFQPQVVNRIIESPHPYQPLTNEFYHIYFPGARSLTLHFSQIGLGSDATLIVYSWDYLTIFYIFSGPYTATNLDLTVDGPGAHVRLITGSEIDYGFQITSYTGYLPKPLPTTFSDIKREIHLKFYWLKDGPEPWRQNVAAISPDIFIPTYSDYIAVHDMNFYSITYDKLLQWYAIASMISQCYLQYLENGNFTIYDLWIPVISYGFNYTTSFDLAHTYTVAQAKASNQADFIYVNATALIGSTLTSVTLNITTYKPYDRNGNPVTSPPSDIDTFAKTTVPGFLFGATPVYGPRQYLTGTDTFVWIRLYAVDPNNPSKQVPIFVDKNHPIKFFNWTNGDKKGSTGIDGKYIALGSLKLYTLGTPPGPGDDPIISHFILKIFDFGSLTLNKPDARFFAQYDIVFILTPWYVDNDWINSTELKKYVDNYLGRVLFVGGYIPRYNPDVLDELGFPEPFDEPSYMLPMGSEVGKGVKMNNYTLPFGIDWIGQTVGGFANILVPDNPIFAPWVDPDGNLQPASIYLGHEIMSMRINATSYKAHTSVWAKDPVYNAIAFYSSLNNPCSVALFISDPFVLSDESYRFFYQVPNRFPFHEWFGLRAVAYLLEPEPPYSFVEKVNKYFYWLGGPDPTSLALNVVVYYPKTVTNNTIWAINFTFANGLPYNVALNVTLQVLSNSTIAGLKKVSSLPLSVELVVPAATRDEEGNLVPGTKTVALGGLAFMKPLLTHVEDMNYYPTYTNFWSTFKFNVEIFANFTQNGLIDYSTPRYYSESFVNILNKIARVGDLPLVSTSEPASLDSYTANLIAKYPYDWKYTNFTIMYPALNVTSLTAKLTGNVTAVAQFFTVTSEGLQFLGTSYNMTPESVGPWYVSIVKYVWCEAWPSYCTEFFGGYWFSGLGDEYYPFSFGVFDGYYPALPHTGHYFAPVFIFISPFAQAGLYSGELQVLDANGNVITSSSINITVDTNPVANIIWDDGLYVNNRPAVDFCFLYGDQECMVYKQVFVLHNWPMLPWINGFEMWKRFATPLNVNVKPSGAFSIALKLLASSIVQNTESSWWQREAQLKALVNSAFANMQGFMLVENNNFNFDNYYFNTSIEYAPEPRAVSLSVRDALLKVLHDNNGTLIIFSQYAPASGYYETGMSMNDLLAFVGSRIYFPVADNTSAAKGVMPLAAGIPPGERPLVAGWKTRMIPPAIPYNTYEFYYYEPDANRKLFIDVNSANIESPQSFSKYVLPQPIQTPEPYEPLTTYMYKITVPNADYVWPVFDYIKISPGTKVEVLDSNLNVVGSIVAVDGGIVEYGDVISGPVRGDTVYIKMASATAVVPGFDAGIKVSYVLYAPSVVDDVAQFYVQNEALPEVISPIAGVVPMPDYGAYQTVPGKWGIALALDTHLTGVTGPYLSVPLPNAKVIAFGEYSWFSNIYFQHRLTHLGSVPGTTDSYISASSWNLNAEIFLRAIAQYVGGEYSKVVSGLSAANDLLNMLNNLANSAKSAGMSVPDAFYTTIQNAQNALSEVNSFIEDGDYISALAPLNNATSLLNTAKTTLLSALESQVLSAKSAAYSMWKMAKDFINTTESYGVDLKVSEAKLKNATDLFNKANETFAAYSADMPDTWSNLITAFTGFNAAKAVASDALTSSGLAALNLATSLRDQAASVLSNVASELNQLGKANPAIGVSNATSDMIKALQNTYNTGVSELSKFNSTDATTYVHALNAITNFGKVLSMQSDVLNAIFKDAKKVVASRLSDLKAAIASVRTVPHDETKVADIDARVPYLESSLASATSISELVEINNKIKEYIDTVYGSITTPTTPIPVLYIAIIVILIIILIFAIVYAITRRRSRVAAIL
jgi:subtilisin family serine protease